MQRNVTLFALIIALIGLFSACKPQYQRLHQVEADRFQAMIQKDTAALRNLLHPELLYVHSNGLTETKAQHISTIVMGKIRYDKMESDRLYSAIWGKTAMNTGKIHVKGLVNQADFDVNLRYTAVYRKVKNQWLLINWQSTKY